MSDIKNYICRICSHMFRTRDWIKHKIRRTEFPIYTPEGSVPINRTGICPKCLGNEAGKLYELYGELPKRDRRVEIKLIIS